MQHLDPGPDMPLAFGEDADETVWAIRDYLFVLRTGLIANSSDADWRAFRTGYAPHRMQRCRHMRQGLLQ